MVAFTEKGYIIDNLFQLPPEFKRKQLLNGINLKKKDELAYLIRAPCVQF